MAVPSLRVSEIPQEGLDIAWEVPPAELDLEPTDVRVRGELYLDAKAVLLDKVLRVSGVLSGTIVRQCVRCLTDYEDHCTFSFAVEYRSEQKSQVRLSQAPPAAGVHRSKEHLPLMESEPYTYSGDCIDLGPMLREQVILGDPIQPLCHENCQGICPVCGRDRNQSPCECPEEQPASPFHVLKTLRPMPEFLAARTARPSKSKPT